MHALQIGRVVTYGVGRGGGQGDRTTVGAGEGDQRGRQLQTRN